ncbi:MAG: hypothetical protein QOH41_2255 [Blastocatellia bacterium]|jgi:hypothetical protein|nr:hypothetical protein [Blastocatellia bacterium]
MSAQPDSGILVGTWTYRSFLNDSASQRRSITSSSDGGTLVLKPRR